ncbi:MAG TPA: hypothetical protein PLM10_00205 [Saccharofermentans sp.]|nr:hypothetical protein [Saccharofermentans sp.]HPE27278.1 hypothetical protein [Saccharofermentans sp.]HPG63887.1 hypothetical protein [Saccharofermentans sp.]HPJ80654.1 hypothetical protein [Saccharofermentans sp.]HPM74727.1 hypothetical protein [Saccharofermentans sp.]
MAKAATIIGFTNPWTSIAMVRIKSTARPIDEKMTPGAYFLNAKNQYMCWVALNPVNVIRNKTISIDIIFTGMTYAKLDNTHTTIDIKNSHRRVERSVLLGGGLNVE